MSVRDDVERLELDLAEMCLNLQALHKRCARLAGKCTGTPAGSVLGELAVGLERCSVQFSSLIVDFEDRGVVKLAVLIKRK